MVVVTIDNNNNNSNNNLSELFYCRNPGDARVKVGSDREAASSSSRPNSGVDEIGVYYILFCAGGPSKIGIVSREYTPTKLIGDMWDLLLKSYYSSQKNNISSKNRTHSDVLAHRVR